MAAPPEEQIILNEGLRVYVGAFRGFLPHWYISMNSAHLEVLHLLDMMNLRRPPDHDYTVSNAQLRRLCFTVVSSVRVLFLQLSIC